MGLQQFIAIHFFYMYRAFPKEDKDDKNYLLLFMHNSYCRQVALEGDDGALNGLLAYSQLEDKLFVQGVLPSRSPSTVWNLFFRSFIAPSKTI